MWMSYAGIDCFEEAGVAQDTYAAAQRSHLMAARTGLTGPPASYGGHV